MQLSTFRCINVTSSRTSVSVDSRNTKCSTILQVTSFIFSVLVCDWHLAVPCITYKPLVSNELQQRDHLRHSEESRVDCYDLVVWEYIDPSNTMRIILNGSVFGLVDRRGFNMS